MSSGTCAVTQNWLGPSRLRTVSSGGRNPLAELTVPGCGRPAGTRGAPIAGRSDTTRWSVAELLGPADLHVLVGDQPAAVDLAHRVVVAGHDLAARVRRIRRRLVRRVVRERLRFRVADEVDVVHVQHV